MNFGSNVFKKYLSSIAIVIWLGFLGMGFGLLIIYQVTPGQMRPPPQHWPDKSSLVRSTERATLVLFAHPKCPCTRSTAESLGWIMARTQGKLRAHVVLVQPTGVREDWSETSLARDFKSIPEVEIHKDNNGAEIKRFQAETSGEVVLYDSQGQLIYDGGITAGRGHPGDNPGRDAIVSLLNGKTARANYPVFGCSLLSSTPEPFQVAHEGRFKSWIQNLVKI